MKPTRGWNPQKNQGESTLIESTRNLPPLERPTRPVPYLSACVSALVPAYNEQAGIGSVLAVLRQVSQLCEIIVVDDGSVDGTAAEVEKQAALDGRIRLIRHATNRGKGAAVFTAWRAARSPYLLTLDADLIGLAPEHIQALIRPVIEHRADMTLGLFSGGRWMTDVSHRLTPWLTGQRCLRAEIMHYVSPEAAAGYGLETALTIAAGQHERRIRAVPWRGVSHPPSEMHRGVWQGAVNRLRMYLQIFHAWRVASGWQSWWARLAARAKNVFLLIFLFFGGLTVYRPWILPNPDPWHEGRPKMAAVHHRSSENIPG